MLSKNCTRNVGPSFPWGVAGQHLREADSQTAICAESSPWLCHKLLQNFVLMAVPFALKVPRRAIIILGA
jgi:hypothetical protein